MKNIFSQTKDYVKQPKRNVFDLSFQNNSTFNFGTLYPVFCKEVIPGDSFKIDTTFALRFLPMAFPVQTKMTANVHFFYVRNRNLWDNWKKFIGHTGDCEFPYISQSSGFFGTGSLADHLGIPTTRVGLYSSVVSYDGNKIYNMSNNASAPFFSRYPLAASDDWGDIYSPTRESGYVPGISTQYVPLTDNIITRIPDHITLSVVNPPDDFDENFLARIIIGYQSSSGTYRIGSYTPVKFSRELIGQNTYRVAMSTSPTSESITFIDAETDETIRFNSYDDFNEYVIGKSNGNPLVFGIYNQSPAFEFPSQLLSTPEPGKFFIGGISFGFPNGIDDVIDLSALASSLNPFIVRPDSVRVSALPFRAYESIYNAFYRNEMNDPLLIDGQPEYDKYVPNTGDGSDNYPYKLYQRNWELDFLTSAVQSPQQGVAPLVGVSSSGNFTFVHKDSNGNIGYFSAQAQLSTDGESITGFKLSDKVTLDGLPYTEPNSVPDEIKRGTVYDLNQMALAGISINDFRNVNALQRWLETNIRRGYKYRDQIKSHFGVDVAYNVLDMPEFIGGVSEPVFVNTVNQTVEQPDEPLGSYAGQASLLASSNHSIKHYCDEHGFIIGIMSIVPVPNYSQLLPKHFLKHNYLDYFFPEFGHIGMQPIDYREVAPVQVYGDDPSKLNNTFGYQRAWYDYLASVDEVHGLFRTNLRNFVLNRQFDTFPVLNKDFLQVDAEQLNDIFTVQDISDKILGQIKFNVIAKRPIPKFGIPRLE